MTRHHPIDPAFEDTVAVIGRRGSGKTYAARGQIERLLSEHRRVCIIDPTGVWWGLRSSADGAKAGFPIVVFGGDHADVPITDGSGAALAELVATSNLPAIVDVSTLTIGGRVRFMTAFLETLYRVNREALRVVFDEADLFAPQRPMPDQAVLLSRMEQLPRRGRVRGFFPWFITQRPAELHKSVLSQADTLVCMRLVAPQDRAALGAWIEGQADKAEGKALVDSLPKLKPGEGWIWAPSHELLVRHNFPMIKTFDSGRTPKEGEKIEAPKRLADVNLDAIKGSLAEAEEAAKANDPKVLKARIAELEKQQKVVPQATDFKELQKRYEAGVLQGCKSVIEIVAGPLKTAMAALSSLDVELRLVLLTNADVESGAAEARQAATLTQSRPVEIRTPPIKKSAPIAQPGAPLGKAERLILTSLAQYPSGRSKSQIGILTGYSAGGGSFNNALSSLRTKGYAQGSGESIRATTAGIEALGQFDPLPTGQALLAHWLARLGKAERSILTVLATAYPRSLSKAEIGEGSGYEPSGGSFNNALSKLRTLELIVGRTFIKASEDFFQ